MTDTTPLRLHGLEVDNYKRIRHLAVAFDGDGTFAVMGGNEQGKSSMFDALEAVLAGRKAPRQAMPVRKGEEKATIVADFGDVIVRRVYTADGKTTLKVTNGDGFAAPSPEETMKRLYSHVALDPLEFANLPAKDQAETLLTLVGFDPRPVDAKRAEAFSKRTDVNRRAKELAAQIAAAPAEVPGLPAEPVSAASIQEQIKAVEVKRQEHRLGLMALAKATEAIETNAARILEYENAIERLRAEAVTLRNDRKTLEAYASHEEPSTDSLFAELQTLEETNEKIRANAERRRLEAEHAEWDDKSADLTEQIEAAEQEKRDGLAAHPMPVAGLEIVDGEVYLDGTPFSQASTGAKIRTSVAIAMKLNPTLRAILVRDANTLDKGNRAVIHDLAIEHGFTVLLELVNTDEDRGIVIVDGEVAEVRA